MAKTYKLLVGQAEGKRQFWRPRCGWEGTIKWILNKQTVKVWAGYIWITWYWTFWFHIKQGISLQDELQSVSKEGLYSTWIGRYF